MGEAEAVGIGAVLATALALGAKDAEALAAVTVALGGSKLGALGATAALVLTAE